MQEALHMHAQNFNLILAGGNFKTIICNLDSRPTSEKQHSNDLPDK